LASKKSSSSTQVALYILVQKVCIIFFTFASVHLDKESNFNWFISVWQFLIESTAKEKDTTKIFIEIKSVILNIVLNQIITFILKLNYFA
jgi:hypothetical protein